jgi:hypothetical protein
MDVMDWSQVSMATRYQHVPVEVLNGIAGQVGGLLWKPRSPETMTARRERLRQSEHAKLRRDPNPNPVKPVNAEAAPGYRRVPPHPRSSSSLWTLGFLTL